MACSQGGAIQIQGLDLALGVVKKLSYPVLHETLGACCPFKPARNQNSVNVTSMYAEAALGQGLLCVRPPGRIWPIPGFYRGGKAVNSTVDIAKAGHFCQLIAENSIFTKS